MTDFPDIDLEGMERLADTVEAEASSDDHAITVRSGPGGRLREVAFSDRAFRMGCEDLSESILALIGEAGRRADEEMRAATDRQTQQ
ncbi:YbaB/EbfC family nucleoid-associated protein [Salininema proteolyticum]|uniref:YbaB/EbfC family nucleoid-associated protein n=1 Tax=Salininema proteolyticum TaxID=1607685 RepID=A0ABV8TWJ4_9ACTN